MIARTSVLTFLCALGVGIGQTSAATTDSSVFWEGMIKRGSLPEIAAALSSPETPKWPGSDNEFSEGDKTRKLVRLLHEKLRAEMLSEPELSSDRVRAFIVIAAALQRAEGYSNILLADSFSRIALYETSKWPVQGGKSFGEVKALAAQIPAYPVILPDVVRALAHRDKTIETQLDRLGGINASDTLFAVAEKLGPEGRASLSNAMSAEGQKFTILFANPSALGLTMRLAGTELFHRISLKSLLVFFEQGGTRQDLNPADITAFRQRMHGAIKAFTYSPLGLKSLSVDNPLSLFELHDDVAKQKAFLQIALD